jgi:hypothetical protein
MWQPENLYEGWIKTGGKACIRDLAVVADWDPSEAVGSLDIRAAISDNRPSGDDRLFVRAVVGTPDGRFLTVGSSRLVAEVPFAAPRTWCVVRLCRQIERPLFWNAEGSDCYSLLLILEDARGEVVDVLAGRFGILSPAVCSLQSLPAWPACEIPSSELLYA